MRGCECWLLEFLIYAAAGFFSGAAGSLGIGGGGILIVILSAFLGYSQQSAQLCNLLFFLPIALLSTIIYARRKQVCFRAVVFMAAVGAVGAVVGYLLFSLLGGKIVGKIFAVMLIFISVREWFSKDEN